jgi:hypothetical protein
MEQKMSKDNTEGRKHRHNIWKTVAIVFIAVFVIIIAVGVFRLFHVKDSMTPATDSEVGAAETVVTNEIGLMGENPSDYIIRVSDWVRVIRFNQTERRVIEVSLKNNSVANANRHIFLIDANTWTVLMHTETEFFGWMYNDFGKFDDNRRFGGAMPPSPMDNRMPPMDDSDRQAR